MSPKKLFNILFNTKIAILELVVEIKNTCVFRARVDKRKIRCACCESKNVRKEGSKVRRFRGCNLGSKKTFMEIAVYKFYCRDCRKKRWMKLPWAVGKLPMTQSFVTYIIGLNAISTLLGCAKFLGLHWKTVKAINKAHLKKYIRRFAYSELRYLSIDEIAVKKGHKYMTIVTDINTGQIIYAVLGRKEEDIAGFLKKLARKAVNLQAIAMDMSKAYIAAVQKHLPNIPIIFDRFHVTKVLTQMVDDTRKAVWEQLAREGHNVKKGDRFLFLRNQSDLDSSDKNLLQTLLDLNTPLTMAHLLKEQFRAFWECKSRGEGEDFFLEWYANAALSGVKQIERAADTLYRHLDGLLNYFDHRINNGKAEGINNKIKTMKRQSYGCRDTEYFILKLYHLHKAKNVLIGMAA